MSSASSTAVPDDSESGSSQEIEFQPGQASAPQADAFGLSDKEWDPHSAALDPDKMKEITHRASGLEQQLHELYDFIKDASEKGELVLPDYADQIPEGWASSAGNPAYYVRSAAGVLSLITVGTRCIRNPGKSTYEWYEGRLCCSHRPEPHCVPPWG